MPVRVYETRILVTMFVGRETPSEHAACRMQENKSLGLGWVPLDTATVMITLRTSFRRLGQLLLAKRFWGDEWV